MEGISVPAGGCFPQAPKSTVILPKKEGIMRALRRGRGIRLTTLTAFLVLFSPLFTYPVAFAQAPPVAQPGTEGLKVIVKSTDYVKVTCQFCNPNFSFYSVHLLLDVLGHPGDDGNPANDKFLFNRTTICSSYSDTLGYYTAGTELIFRLHVYNDNKDYFTGPASRNPDQQPHFRAQADWKPNETLISFESRFNGPFEYIDLSFSVTPTTTSTTTTPPPTSTTTAPSPGWYKNSGPSIIYEAPYQNSILRVVWENSYIYQHPGTDNLYWYAQVAYQNIGSQPLPAICTGITDPSLAKEHIRGDQGIPPNSDSYVAAEETFCSRNPNFTDVVAPGGTFYYWAIFHNVPSQGELSLELSHDPPTRSAWLKPWAIPLSAPPPTECPPELVKLGTCRVPSNCAMSNAVSFTR
jgi:hypothetical protein